MQFSFSRFGRLLRKHTAEHYRYYIMATGVLIGIMALALVGMVYLNSGPLTTRGQAGIFVTLLFGAGTIFTSTIFADLGDKKKAIAVLTLPTSHLEKYLVGWLYSFPIFLMMYLACFYLVANLVLPLDDWQGQQPEILNVFSNETEQRSVFVLFSFLHSIAFWGAIFFRKWHFIKTAFVFFLLMGAFVFLNNLFMERLLGRELQGAIPFANIMFQEGKNYYAIQFSETKEYLLAFVPLGVALLVWAAAYFRLREKEV